jgi:hypothetical protein
VVRALGHVGYNTALFSGISARRGGLSTAIEAGSQSRGSNKVEQTQNQCNLFL